MDELQPITFLVFRIGLYLFSPVETIYSGKESMQKESTFNDTIETAENLRQCSYHCSKNMDQFTDQFSVLGYLAPDCCVNLNFSTTTVTAMFPRGERTVLKVTEIRNMRQKYTQKSLSE